MQDRNYDAVIFDMDGTLLDTLEDLKDAVNHALRVLAMPERTLEEIRQFVGNGAERLLELAVPGGAGNPQYGRALALFREYYAVHCNDKTRPYDGVIPLLQKLAEEGYALAIVSNKPDFAVKELCGIYFSGLAGTAAGQREGVAKKPAPDTVQAALRELGVPKERAVYVGDSEVDVMTAANAEIPCISVLWGFRERDFLLAHGACRFAERPEEIRNYL